MPQPCEWEVGVRAPGSPVGFWDAFAATVGRIVVPVAGQTSLDDASSDVSSSERHQFFTEDCAGELLEGERMLTPQFSVAGWPDIRSEVQKLYAGAVATTSSFFATIPLAPKPLTIPVPLFRVQSRPDRETLAHLAGVELQVDADSASVIVSVERWLLTEGMSPFGLETDGILRLITDIDDACRELSRRSPGSEVTYRVRPPTTHMVPELEEALKKMMADAQG